MNHANPGDHATEIDRNNRTVKERYRAQYHRLPFQNIPKVMIRYLDLEVVRKLDYFPVKGVLSPYYIPWTILYQQPLGYNKHCTIPFGAFVQANNDNNPKSPKFSRTIERIYLRSLDKIKGGH